MLKSAKPNFVLTNTIFCIPLAQTLNLAYRDFSTENLNKFKAELNLINWEILNTFDSAQLSYNFFHENFLTIFNLYFPLNVKTVNKNTHALQPWMSKGILISRLHKIKLCKESLKNPSPESILAYKVYRNLYNTIVKASRKTYFEKEFIKHQSDLKKTWQTLRKAINFTKKNEKTPIQTLLNNNVSTSDPLEIASIFNNFFANVPNNVVKDIHPTDTPPPSSPPKDCFFTLLNENEFLSNSTVIEAIKSLASKNTADPDGISSNFVKKFALLLSEPLKLIFTKSFHTGVVPTQLKTAKIIPLYKSGDSQQPTNYRPIALLSTFAKILEKIVYKKLSTFIENNNILSHQQFGFRKNHLPVHPMLHFYDYISQTLERKKFTVAIFCDLQKAFDCVNPDLLLSKLQKIGIDDLTFSWFRSYLTNRFQFVSIGDQSSPLCIINCGVPQGSILGPLLFLLYINDLPLCSNFLTLLFADDTTLLLSSDNLNDLIVNVNTELQKVQHFFRYHKMALHSKKTK